jgi:RNA polymerase sigma-70 factor (ECF subfamily)
LVPALDPQSLPRHLDRLYRAAWALCGSPHDAEDLVQETFARVLARPRRLRGADELAYLMTALRNTFLTQRRTAARRPLTRDAALEESDTVDPRTEERPEEALQAREVFAVIAGLPERYRLALVAVDIVGLSYREAADTLETREATIATRVFRARQQVAHRLAPTPEDTHTAQPVSKDTHTAQPVSKDTHTAQPVSKDTHTTQPVSKDTHTAQPVSKDTHTTQPVSKDTHTAQPVSKDTHTAQPVSKDTHTTQPVSEDAPAAQPAPGDAPVPEALHTQREGRRPRRRLIERGER